MEKQRQYVIKKMRYGNYHVLRYINGRLKCHNTITECNINQYISQLKNMGYTQAFYLPEYEERIKFLKQMLEKAIAEYDDIKTKSLFLLEDEILRYKQYTLNEEDEPLYDGKL